MLKTRVRFPYTPFMNTKHKGNITELRVATRLLELGYTVLFPYGDNARYDLVYQDEEGFHRVQCKTGRMKGGVVYFDTTSTHAYSKGRPYEDVEYFGVYSQETGEIYLVPAVDAPQSGMSLRVQPTKNNQEEKITWAKTYLV